MRQMRRVKTRLLLRLCADARNLDFGVRLTMRALAQVVLAAAELHDRLFLAFASEQDLVELDVSTHVSSELLNSQNRPFANAILLTTRGNYGVHDSNELQADWEDPSGKGREVYGPARSLATRSGSRT